MDELSNQLEHTCFQKSQGKPCRPTNRLCTLLLVGFQPGLDSQKAITFGSQRFGCQTFGDAYTHGAKYVLKRPCCVCILFQVVLLKKINNCTQCLAHCIYSSMVPDNLRSQLDILATGQTYYYHTMFSISA